MTTDELLKLGEECDQEAAIVSGNLDAIRANTFFKRLLASGFDPDSAMDLTYSYLRGFGRGR